ncbi:protein of unknown function [[Clostridium] ultunense Esp]|uniref:Uncharacterized protein n=1 Tax=[Clostridium] ultunense Esp TaxID=1288971 RepID=A0A1M4PRD5_9FIRM|nr:protein of unknown function [[Clostridium] ultunense Esp]
MNMIFLFKYEFDKFILLLDNLGMGDYVDTSLGKDLDLRKVDYWIFII